MALCHDFINGFYYEDYWTGERKSPTEYYQEQSKKKELRKGQHYILIKLCEDKIRGNKIYCSLQRWHYYADRESAPKNVVILSEKEYIKNTKKHSYYRRYSGDSYTSLEVEKNIKLKVDKVEKVCDFFLCTIKGNGKLYTEEEFYSKFL